MSQTVSDGVAAPIPTTDDVVGKSRQRYQTTVEDVAVQLHTYGIDRDARTIQRWCKSGKLDAVIDHDNGDRWLIDQMTVQPVIDSILKNMSRQPQPFTRVSRPGAAFSTTPNTTSRQASDFARDTFEFQADNQADVSPTRPVDDATSDESNNVVATLTRRVAELEKENALLEVDKQVREQMVDYVKEQFSGMLDTALERTERVGQLEAENKFLREALPAARVETSTQASMKFSDQASLDQPPTTGSV